ncbi:hypothetical protein HPHPA14_1152 [Helicobacter pylori Hp A-14]|nr:hypothetical protein HPHPA14_1152 [Helicobacter pylori Hp A-14]
MFLKSVIKNLTLIKQALYKRVYLSVFDEDRAFQRLRQKHKQGF